MSHKIEHAHQNIDGITVAQMIINFTREFRDVYPEEVLIGFHAVGPLQSFIGHAIDHGLLQLGPRAAKEGK